MTEGLQYFPYDPHGPTVQRTIHQPSELLGPSAAPREEPVAPPVPPARPERLARARAPKKRSARRQRGAGVLDMPELSPLWSRLYLAGQKLEGDEQLRQEHVAAASSDIAHAVRYELDTRVDPKDMSPAALNQRLALIRRLRAQIATHGATVEWNESRTVSRWEANPGLTLIVLDNIEERLRRAAAGYG